MKTLTDHRLRGASPCDQELHDVVASERDKKEMLSGYENLACTASSRTSATSDQIIEDEQRAHRRAAARAARPTNASR